MGSPLGTARVFSALAFGLVAASALVAREETAFAFAQASPVSAGSHEFLTLYPARATGLAELIDLDLNDGMVTDGGALKAMFEVPKSAADRAYSAMVGQRWVDAMGFTKTYESEESHTAVTDITICLEAVAQRPDHVQYDHFLRRECDTGTPGRKQAIAGSIAAFKRYFLKAVSEPETRLNVAHGGFGRVDVAVNRAYFLFGRAVHLFQDSFSWEHAIRSTDGRKVVDIKSYACTDGSPQHAHEPPAYWNPSSGDNAFRVYPTWKLNLPPGVPGIPTTWEIRDRDTVQKHLKTDPEWFLKYGNHESARYAFRAMKELWTAFITARKTPAKAEREIDEVIKNWLAYDADAASTVAMNPRVSKEGCKGYAANQIEALRGICMGFVGNALPGRGNSFEYFTGNGSDSFSSPSSPNFNHAAEMLDFALAKPQVLLAAPDPVERSCPAFYNGVQGSRQPTRSVGSAPGAPLLGASAAASSLALPTNTIEIGSGHVTSKKGYVCKEPSACPIGGSNFVARLDRCAALKVLGEIVADSKGEQYQKAPLLWIRVEAGGKRGFMPLVDLKAGQAPSSCK